MSARVKRMAWLAGAPTRAALAALIHGYRLTIGRLLGERCRFHPTCSAYALEAIRVHGALKGSAMAMWRVLRCSPLTVGGLDPVPPAGSRPVRSSV